MMDNMAYYNDTYFNDNFRKYHPNDTSLICQNNILYYNADPIVISGMIGVQNNERISLGQFRISNINNNIWQLEPAKLYFYIRESVKVMDIDVKESVMDIYKIASKSYLEDNDKLTLSYIVDYYNSLKTIENYLSYNLYDSYKYIKAMFLEVQSMSKTNMTPGFKLIYEKLFGEISKEQLDEESASQNRGVARTRFDTTKPKVNPIPTYIEEDRDRISDAAYISIVTLVLIILLLVIGTMTYIFA